MLQMWTLFRLRLQLRRLWEVYRRAWKSLLRRDIFSTLTSIHASDWFRVRYIWYFMFLWSENLRLFIILHPGTLVIPPLTLFISIITLRPCTTFHDHVCFCTYPIGMWMFGNSHYFEDGFRLFLTWDTCRSRARWRGWHGQKRNGRRHVHTFEKSKFQQSVHNKVRKVTQLLSRYSWIIGRSRRSLVQRSRWSLQSLLGRIEYMNQVSLQWIPS